VARAELSVPASAATTPRMGAQKRNGGPPARRPPVRYCARRLLLLAGAGSLGRTEGNPSPHGLLLNGGRGTPELLRDLAGRGSRFRERLQGLQLTGAPGCAIVRWTFRHYSILQKTPNCRVGTESYTVLWKKARPTSQNATNRHVVGSGQFGEMSEPALRLESLIACSTRGHRAFAAGFVKNYYLRWRLSADSEVRVRTTRRGN